MQGIYIRDNDRGWRRPKSKEEVREATARSLNHVLVEATSLFDIEPEGSLMTLLDSAPHTIHFVGPDPSTKRSFYGTLMIERGGKVTVK